MRVDPSPKALRGDVTDPLAQARVERITRMIAIILAFGSTFGLFLKILFF